MFTVITLCSQQCYFVYSSCVWSIVAVNMPYLIKYAVFAVIMPSMSNRAVFAVIMLSYSNHAVKIKESKITRGHNFTLVKKQSRLDVSKYSQRTINVLNKL